MVVLAGTDPETKLDFFSAAKPSSLVGAWHFIDLLFSN